MPPLGGGGPLGDALAGDGDLDLWVQSWLLRKCCFEAYLSKVMLSTVDL
jgi:hypothetical protein